MDNELDARQIAEVIALSPELRYNYFIAYVADKRQVWSLRNAEGWVAFAPDDNASYMPVWPHSAFAAAYLSDTATDYVPTAIELDEWMDSQPLRDSTSELAEHERRPRAGRRAKPATQLPPKAPGAGWERWPARCRRASCRARRCLLTFVERKVESRSRRAP